MPDGVVGLSFGRVADDYDRLRPEYAPEAIEHLVRVLGLDDTSTVLDLAAGTGAVTHSLQHHVAHAVVVGDAFHWFDAQSAIAEIRRVLTSGGGLALVWRSWPIPEQGAARDLLDVRWRRFHGDTTFQPSWREALEQAFGPLECAAWQREVVLDGDAYADLCLTASCPSALPDDERADLRRLLRAALPGEHRLDAPTELWWWRT